MYLTRGVTFFFFSSSLLLFYFFFISFFLLLGFLFPLIKIPDHRLHCTLMNHFCEFPQVRWWDHQLDEKSALNATTREMLPRDNAILHV